MENENFSSEDSMESTALVFNGKKVNVIDYMPLSTQTFLLDNYFATLQDETLPLNRRILFAEAGLQLGIVEMMTDIDVDENFSLDEIHYGGVFEKIVGNIKNYWDFMDIVSTTRYDFLRQVDSKQSLGNKFEKLLDNANIFLRNIASVDLDKDTLKELVDTLLNTQKEFNDKWAIQPTPSGIEQEASKIAKATTTRKPRKKVVKGEEQS